VEVVVVDFMVHLIQEIVVVQAVVMLIILQLQEAQVHQDKATMVEEVQAEV
jgi:hypothetical protein